MAFVLYRYFVTLRERVLVEARRGEDGRRVVSNMQRVHRLMICLMMLTFIHRHAHARKLNNRRGPRGAGIKKVTMDSKRHEGCVSKGRGPLEAPQ